MATRDDLSTEPSWIFISNRKNRTPEPNKMKNKRRKYVIPIYFAIVATFLISIVGTALIGLVLASNEPHAPTEPTWTPMDVCLANDSLSFNPEVATLTYYSPPEKQQEDFTWYSFLNNPLLQTAVAELLQIFCLVKITWALFQYLHQHPEPSKKSRKCHQERQIKIKTVREMFLQRLLADRTQHLQKLKKLNREVQRVVETEKEQKNQLDIYKAAFESRGTKIKQSDANKWGQKHEDFRPKALSKNAPGKRRKRTYASKKPL